MLGNVVGSSCSLPDVCQGDVQSGSGEDEGPSLLAGKGGWRLPGASVTADAVAGVALSSTASSKGSKMRGSASDDTVPSMASSGDSGTTVSAASL